MKVKSTRGLSDTLVGPLNELLVRLGLHCIILESPFDLTPSLLVAILESILQSRLDIPTDVRETRDLGSKVQAMKMFLGVLEGDIIGMDIGLSEVDPRRLAAGEWDEVVFVGELLCWLGKKMGVMSGSSTETTPKFPRPILESPLLRTSSSSNQSTVTNTVHSNLSMSRSVPADSNTTAASFSSITSQPPEPLPSHTLPTTTGNTVQSESLMRPRCIHDVEEPSFLIHSRQSSGTSSIVPLIHVDVSYCTCPLEELLPLPSSATTPAIAPVRYTGWIGPVDAESEIRSFEATKQDCWATPNENSYSDSMSELPQPSTNKQHNRILTLHPSPTQYTLALLNERAKLLAELAELKTAD